MSKGRLSPLLVGHAVKVVSRMGEGAAWPPLEAMGALGPNGAADRAADRYPRTTIDGVVNRNRVRIGDDVTARHHAQVRQRLFPNHQPLRWLLLQEHLLVLRRLEGAGHFTLP